MSYIINDGSTTNYPEAPWKESQKDIVEKWLKNMNIIELPVNYKLFSKIEKSMTKATKIITHLYGHPSGNYFETPIEAKVHINYLLGKTNICHCIYCKPSNAIYMKQNKRKFENDEVSEKLFIKNKKLPLKKSWNHYKNRQSAISVDRKAEEWKWYNGYRENEIIWAPMLENENNSSHSIFWTFQIVKRLSSLELTDISTFNKLISFEKVIKYVSNSIIKPSSKVNLNEILKNTEEANSYSNIWDKINIIQNNIYNPNHDIDNNKEKTTHLEMGNNNNNPQEIDEKTLNQKKKDKENLMTLLSGTYDDDDDDDDDFVLSEEDGDEYYTDDSEEHIRKPPSDSGSEVSVGSVLNDTQNNSVQQIESLGYICRQLPLQNISIEQEDEEKNDNEKSDDDDDDNNIENKHDTINNDNNSDHSKENKKSIYTYYFIPFKIIIPFLMYDPCSKNNILWNRAVMQAIDLSSSFSIPVSKEYHSDINSHSLSYYKTLKSYILNSTANTNNEINFSNKKETRINLEYFRFGAEQLHVGDLLRLDLSNNSSTRWIKTVNNYERVDKHEYLEVTKIVEIRNKAKSMATIEITGNIYFNVFAENFNNNENSISSKKEIASPISSPSVSSSSVPVISSNNNSSSSNNNNSSSNNVNFSTISSSSSFSSLFIPEFSDILWICSGETRTVHLNEICGRYYVNCPTLERKMRISSEQAWDKDNSVFGSSKQELLILEYESKMHIRNSNLNH